MATDEQARARGFATPAGSDLLSSGDDVIRQNARAAADIAMSIETLKAVNKGDPGDPSVFERRGSGPPNGAVSAPIGTYYTDTLGTAGAWRWIKTSGTGNTGWSVVFGETPSLDLAPLLNSPFEPVDSGQGIRIHRLNSIVVLYLALRAKTATSGQVPILTLPAGYRPTAFLMLPSNSGNPADFRVSSGGSFNIGNNLAAGGLIRTAVTWVTSNAWPSA